MVKKVAASRPPAKPKSAAKASVALKAASPSKAPAIKSPAKAPVKIPLKSKPVSASQRASMAKVKISKPPATAIAMVPIEPPEPPTADELRKLDSGLSKKERDAYRVLLLEKRADILGDVASLKDQALTDGGNLSNMPLHMADVGSDQYEQEAMLGLVESERKLLHEINEALHRLEQGTFGLCVETGKPIGKARLDITPWAKYCIEVVREREKQGRR